jgi:hypothetical protein
MSLSQLHLIITIRTFNSFWIPNPARLSPSCTSDLRAVIFCLHFCTSALLDQLYKTFGQSRRDLHEGLFRVFGATVPSVLAAARTEAVRCPLPRKLLSEAPLSKWRIAAFRRRVTVFTITMLSKTTVF